MIETKHFYLRFYTIWNRISFGVMWDFSPGWDITIHFGFFNLQFGDPLDEW